MQKHIVLIENDNILRENTIDILTLHAFKVTAYINGEIAIKEIIKAEPDLVICDIMMPSVTGYQVLELIRKNTKTAATPFIFLTSKSEKSDIRLAMDMGADDYITKPFTIKEFIHTVNARLYKAEREKLNYHNKLDKLAHIISHEVNTPLNSIMGLTQLMMDENDESRSNNLSYLNAMHNAGKTLKKTHERLLNFITVERDKSKFDSRVVTMQEAIDYFYKVADDHSGKCTKGGNYEIKHNIEGLNSSILNGHCFFVVVEELIRNCFKYAHSRTTIKIGIKILNDKLLLNIIYKSKYKPQKDSLSQGGTDYLNVKDGYGLGLYIVEKINNALNLEFHIDQKGREIAMSIKFALTN